jgi:hypothetical protein
MENGIMNTQDPMAKYRALVDQLANLRQAHLGFYCQDEGPLLDEMTAIWLTFDERQCDIAEWLVQKVPNAARQPVLLDSDFMLPGTNHTTAMMARRAG